MISRMNVAPFELSNSFYSLGLRLKLLNVIVSRALLGGCRTPKEFLDYRIRDAAGNGIVVTSLAYWRSRSACRELPEALMRVSLYYRRLGSRRKGSISFDAAFHQNDLSDVAAELFVLELEPGSYEFYDFRVERGCSAVGARREFSIPFTVEQGRIAYIGEHNLDLILGRSMFGPGL